MTVLEEAEGGLSGKNDTENAGSVFDSGVGG